MIKCNVNICGLISQSGIVKQSKENTPFIAFGVVVPIVGKDGSGAELYINVSCTGNSNTVAQYSSGRRVAINGTLYIRKVGEKLFYNLRTDDKVEFCQSDAKDKISGSMEFHGKIKNEIKDGLTKNQKPFQTFSAFSSDKDGENVAFTWVRFYNPHPVKEEWFKQDGYISVQGDLAFDVYKNNIYIECRAGSISEYEFEKKGE